MLWKTGNFVSGQILWGKTLQGMRMLMLKMGNSAD